MRTTGMPSPEHLDVRLQSVDDDLLLRHFASFDPHRISYNFRGNERFVRRSN